MLALERHVDERLVITVPPGDTERRMVVIVKGIGQKRVILGFEGPREIKVDRGECEAKRKAKVD